MDNETVKQSDVKVTVGTHVPLEKKMELQKKADEFGISISKYISQLLDDKPNHITGNKLTEEDLDQIEERIKASLTSMTPIYTSVKEEDNGDEQEEEEEEEEVSPYHLITYRLLSAVGLLDDTEKHFELVELIQDDFELHELFELLEIKGFIRSELLKDGIGNILPFELQEDRLSLMKEFIEWMIANGKAKDAESVLIGNTISYLNTGVRNWGSDAEVTKKFLKRFKEVAQAKKAELDSLTEVKEEEVKDGE